MYESCNNSGAFAVLLYHDFKNPLPLFNCLRYYMCYEGGGVLVMKCVALFSTTCCGKQAQHNIKIRCKLQIKISYTLKSCKNQTMYLPLYF
jgi:hypothetical protein